MQQINLNPIANQKFTFSSGSVTWEITLKYNPIGFTMATISADGKELCQNLKCFANQKILPYDWQNKNGNFAFKTQGGNYPVFSDFGTTCFFYFLEKNEVL